MLQYYWKFPNRKSRQLDSSTTTQVAQIMVQYGRPSRSSWKQSVWSSFGRTVMGKAIWETSCWSTVGRRFPIGNVCSCTLTNGCSYLCMWMTSVGWKETKHWSDVESTQQRSRFGRTNIFLWSCILWMHSKTMWNKQKYCGQLQNHVWIVNFCGENRKTTIPSKSSYFFMVSWYGRSCQEMCGTILWVGQQDDSTILQRIYSLHRWPPLQRRRNEICRRIVTSMLSNCKKPCTWHVLEDLIFYGQWTNLHDQSPNGSKPVTNAWIDWFHIFLTHVNTNSIAMWVIFQNNAHCDCFKTPTLREILRIQHPLQVEHLCVLGSHTFVPVSWMCKKQTSVSHSSTESEIISLDAGLRLDGIPALWMEFPHLIYGIWSLQFLKTRIRTEKNRATCSKTNVKFVHHLTQFKKRK